MESIRGGAFSVSVPKVMELKPSGSVGTGRTLGGMTADTAGGIVGGIADGIADDTGDGMAGGIAGGMAVAMASAWVVCSAAIDCTATVVGSLAALPAALTAAPCTDGAHSA